VRWLVAGVAVHVPVSRWHTRGLYSHRRRQVSELQDITGAGPFEIWVADAKSGAGKQIFRSKATAGGFAQFLRRATVLRNLFLLRADACR